MTAAGPRRGSFASTVVVTFGTYVGAATLSLVNLVVVARTLGPTGRGDVVFLITVATLAGYLSTLSVQEANANIGGSEPAARARLATNSLFLALLCGAGAAAAVYGLVSAFPAVGGDVARTLLWLALAVVPLVILRLYLNFLAQADYHFAVTNVAWLVGPLTTVAVNAALALVGELTVARAFAAWIAGQALGILILVVHAHRTVGFGRPDVRLAARTLWFGVRAHGGRIMAIGHYRIDQWFVGSMSGSRELGLYSVATAWAEILSYLPGVVVLVQRPDLVRATREAAAQLAARIFRVTLLLTLPLAAVVIVAAPFLCVTLLGAEFRGSVDDLRVLALGAFGFVALELLGSALTAQRKPMLTTGAVSVAFAATIVLNILLIPPYGGLGAAVASALAATAGGAAAALIFSRALRVPLGTLAPRARDIPWLLQEARTRLSRGRSVASGAEP